MAMSDLSIIGRGMAQRRWSIAGSVVLMGVAVASLLLVVSLRPAVTAAARQAHPPQVLADASDVQTQEWLTTIDGLSALLIGVAALGALGGGGAIAVTLCAGVEARRPSIAILRLLGLSQARLASQVITEAAMIGSLGALAGAGIAIVGLPVANRIVAGLLGLEIHARLHAGLTLFIALAAVALASLTGLAPAILLSRTGVTRWLVLPR